MKYLVISYDDDEQQAFYDHVIAPTEEDAMAQIDELRDYAIASCAYTADELRKAADLLDATTGEQIAGALYEIAEERGLVGKDAWHAESLQIEPDDTKPGWHLTHDGLVYTPKPE